MKPLGFNAAIGASLLLLSFASEAACPILPDQSTPLMNTSTAYTTVSGLAYATYFLEISAGGGNASLGNLSIQGVPGFAYQPPSRVKGFIGSGTTLYITWLVGRGSQTGYRDLTYRIRNSAGQVVCSDEFRVTVY
ncbi:MULTISPECIES: hypothetical protein [unclassified Lysobacter]|uniref:hypothetical protein n=1 Tax=unclassified Lysobacter TaxID=2635362 RepID=UPI001BEB5691|nr:MULTISPECIES: hypothetical protein [unclassified Lysobacter]MBT2746598.1 hypothetical protein [Lysobacter sp. ISL-42]MBT2753407.1 hypothetical protein [Lysobacter sp. ISL-50]MBT2775517.1 hypothetical protein [Lysobacter sp. ISL-54]MBT2782947.1 hypothetical protein [Lysobacter sp. ISL-52]